MISEENAVGPSGFGSEGLPVFRGSQRSLNGKAKLIETLILLLRLNGGRDDLRGMEAQEESRANRFEFGTKATCCGCCIAELCCRLYACQARSGFFSGRSSDEKVLAGCCGKLSAPKLRLRLFSLSPFFPPTSTSFSPVLPPQLSPPFYRCKLSHPPSFSLPRRPADALSLAPNKQSKLTSLHLPCRCLPKSPLPSSPLPSSPLPLWRLLLPPSKTLSPLPPPLRR